MTVKQLIKELSKMPSNAEVYWADHDHGEYETNGIVKNIWLTYISGLDEEELRANLATDMPDRYVVLRP